jgi:hypothetical protein
MLLNPLLRCLLSAIKGVIVRTQLLCTRLLLVKVKCIVTQPSAISQAIFSQKTKKYLVKRPITGEHPIKTPLATLTSVLTTT